MYCLLLLILLFCGKVKSQDNVFTINKVSLQAFPQNKVRNGNPLILNCSVDISKNEHFRLNYTFSFFKDDELLFTNTIEQDSAHYTISQARFSSSGVYECSLSVEEKKKSSNPLTIKVEGIMKPILSVQRTAVMEGENVLLRCEVPEEKPPFFFTFYKTAQLANGVVHERKRSSQRENFVELEFPIDAGDNILYFECAVQMNSEAGREISERSNRTIVTVTEPFSVPKITIDPPQNITEGDKICITCSTVLLRQDQTEIILQKNKTILNSTKGRETLTYCKIVKMEDNGNYMCKVEHGSVSKTDKEELVVAAPVSLPVLYQPVSQIAVLEKFFVLQCYSRFGTLPITYTLYRGNIPIRKIVTRENIPANFTVKANSIHESGQYRCRANNGHSLSQQSKRLNVTIIAPVVNVTFEREPQENIEDGNELLFFCSVASGSFPIEFHFFKENDAKLLHRVIEKKKLSVIWHRQSFTSQDEGSYFCRADNQANSFVESQKILIKVVMASWKKGLIVATILLIFLAAIITIVWLNCRLKAKAKNTSTELSVSKRATNSVGGKLTTGHNNEGEFYYGSGHNEDGEKNHISAKEDNRGSDLDAPEVEYTEVQVSVPDPYRAPVMNNETVYTEIRKTINDAEENRHSRIEPSPDGT
ncbi:platelet endothelial cell adhesion molecule isoform X2 [Crotalus tigris]|uniref:platelet endothelial cell adhesion molecule isoform X2 n=1 Tax=Crotalus tigris TaxID=88082 RepID=UPI00192F99C5|nr:platelet endothelial cell adhesion molecule isoform X2 [Crotalus tigris]